MDPVIKAYVTWGVIAIALAGVIYVVSGQKTELDPKWRAAGSVLLAVLIIVFGGGRSRYSTGTRGPSMFSRDVAAAKRSSAADQGLRDSAKQALDKAATANDVESAKMLILLGNRMHLKGWSDEALPLYDKSYAILTAKGAGNGDWALDQHLVEFLDEYVEALKANGRASDAGMLTVMRDKMNGLHAARIRR